MNLIKAQDGTFVNADTIASLSVRETDVFAEEVPGFEIVAGIVSSEFPLQLAEYPSREEAQDELTRLAAQLVVNRYDLVYVMPGARPEVAS